MHESSAEDPVEAIFHEAAERPASEREAFLTQACGDDAALRTKVEQLLAAEEQGEDFLADPTLQPDVLAEGTDELIGSSIGPYKVLQAIGEGGYGMVYLAEQREPVTRRVALKVIKLGMDTKQVIARFEAERQALAMMEHPNIAKVLDAGATQAGRPYFVMELVRGVPITEYCDHGKLETEKRLALFIDVCRAVQHAHQKGIIHRDLKPSNILITLHDGIPVPKVIDFGIAKATNARLTEKTLFTDFHQFIGTPAYTSPEQVEMSGIDIDTRSDIYSLGVLLYELLTGTTPIESDTFKNAAHVEIQRTIMEVEPPKPSTRVTDIRKRSLADSGLHIPESHIDQDLDWIAMRALEKDRERRYGSAQALAQDVESFLRQEPVTAAAPSTTYRLRKFARRNQKALLMATALGMMLVVGSIVSVWQAVSATQASNRELEARVQAQTRLAEANALEARQNLYIADMNFAQSAVEDGIMETAIEILERHIPQPGQEDLRDFEWRYLWQQTHRELFTLFADDNPDDEVKPDPIYDVALSPSGNVVASSSRLGKVRVWDATTRRELFRSEITSGRFTWLEFSSDGRFLAAAGRTSNKTPSQEVVMWDLARRKEIQRFSVEPTSWAIDPKFTPNNKTLIAGDSNGSVWFWDIETGESETVSGHAKEVTSISVAANAPRMVTAAERDGISLWDLHNREILYKVNDKEWYGFMSGAAISPDGKWIAVAPRVVSYTTIIEAASGETVTKLRYDSQSHGVRFSPNGKTLAMAETSGAIRFYDTTTWRETATYFHHGHQLNAMAYSGDGSLLVTGGDNGKVMIWPGLPDPNKGLLEAGEIWAVSSVSYVPESQLIGVGNFNGSVQIWNSKDETLAFSTPERTAARGMVYPEYSRPFHAFHPSGEQLAVSVKSIDGKNQTPRVELWNIKRQQVVNVLPQKNNLSSLAYSEDGRHLATGSTSRDENGNSIHIWDLTTLSVVLGLPESPHVECLAFSIDSKLLASEGWGDAGIRIWDLASGKIIAALHGHVQPVGNTRFLQFSPDGSLIASAGYDSRVILWDTSTWKPGRILSGHRSQVVHLAFSPDGRRLATSGADNQCILWNVTSGFQLAHFTGVTVDFAPRGDTLAIGGFYPYKTPERWPTESRTVRLYRAPLLDEIEGE